MKIFFYKKLSTKDFPSLFREEKHTISGVRHQYPIIIKEDVPQFLRDHLLQLFSHNELTQLGERSYLLDNGDIGKIRMEYDGCDFAFPEMDKLICQKSINIPVMFLGISLPFSKKFTVQRWSKEFSITGDLHYSKIDNSPRSLINKLASLDWEYSIKI